MEQLLLPVQVQQLQHQQAQVHLLLPPVLQRVLQQVQARQVQVLQRQRVPRRQLRQRVPQRQLLLLQLLVLLVQQRLPVPVRQQRLLLSGKIMKGI